jgi:nitrate reductase NapD
MSATGLSRRAFLQGGTANQGSGSGMNEPVVHISSAVISVLPPRQDEVMRSLSELPDLEVRHTGTGKIVVVMEAADSGVIGARLAEIAGWPGVLSANMVFEQVERLDNIGDRNDAPFAP